jgi:AcrR family transcriptional regulator
MADEIRPLPPGLDLLWGRRERGRRGPKPAISVESIVAAAIRVADDEGLAAVSMARVARELGFTTMSLYRHVTGKDELLQLMWNASVNGAEELVLSGGTWRERLCAWAMMQRAVFERHSWLTEMPTAAPPVAPNTLTFLERGLETLEDTCLADGDKLRIVGLLSSYTLSAVRIAHDAAPAAAGDPARPWTFDELVRQFADPQHYPILHRIASAPRRATPDEVAEFAFGIERILDGVAALIASRG